MSLHQRLQSLPQTAYYIICAIGLLLPNILFGISPYMSAVGTLLNIVMPLGLWLILLALGKRPGRVLLVCLPLMLLINIVQLVLIVVFNGAIIGVDLLMSLFSASGDEAGELLGGLILPIVIVLLVHVCLCVLAWYSLRSREELPKRVRVRGSIIGVVLMILGLPLAAWANSIQSSHTLRGDVYPLNVFYNMYVTVDKLSELAHLDETSSGHSYGAVSERPEDREVYVFVLGETSRAYSHQLYGYPRETNPLLTKRQQEDSTALVVFRDMLTQSNTTSKSAPIILSPADAENADRLNQVKGIMSAMREAGFHTAFISNQPANRSFLDKFAYEANEHYRIKDLIKASRPMSQMLEPIYDADMLPYLDKVLAKGHKKLFIIMHGYGSHWSYIDRYPKAFKHFKDDEALGANARERDKLTNAYDNAIRYNDYFLSEVIKRLEVLPETKTAMYYTSDHGEDIFDDSRERILHSTPSISYYQLHVPSILWFGKAYQAEHAEIVSAALNNQHKAATSRSNLHTLLTLAGVQTRERQDTLSLLSPSYKEGLRSYLNDRYECVPIKEMMLDDEDLQMMKRMKLKDL